MKTTIVASRSPVTVIGGGQPGPNDLNEALQLAPMCVGVDGGANLVSVQILVGTVDETDAFPKIYLISFKCTLYC